MFNRTAGSKTTIGRQGAADKPSKRVANVLVSLTQAFGPERRVYRPTRVEHLGPTGARAEECEGALCVKVPANGVQKIADLDSNCQHPC